MASITSFGWCGTSQAAQRAAAVQPGRTIVGATLVTSNSAHCRRRSWPCSHTAALTARGSPKAPGTAVQPPAAPVEAQAASSSRITWRTAASRRPRRWCWWAGEPCPPPGALLHRQAYRGAAIAADPHRDRALGLAPAAQLLPPLLPPLPLTGCPSVPLACPQLWHPAAPPHPHRAQAHHRLWCADV